MIAPVFVALALLNAVALTAALRPPRAWAVKLALILGVFAFSFTVIHAQTTGNGYPVPGSPPEGAQLVGCDVVEPVAVYLWAVPAEPKASPFGYKAGEGEPRAYRVRYSRDLHAACEAAKKAMKQGIRVGITKVHVRGRQGPRSPVHFYQLPPPHFQQKERTP